jgi:hypothetical protein
MMKDLFGVKELLLLAVAALLLISLALKCDAKPEPGMEELKKQWKGKEGWRMGLERERKSKNPVPDLTWENLQQDPEKADEEEYYYLEREGRQNCYPDCVRLG